MRNAFAIAVSTLLVVATAFVPTPQAASFQDQKKQIYQPTGNEGTIVGSISFEGKPPQPKRIDTFADPVCQNYGDLYTEDVIVKAGKLANVFVYVRSGYPIELYSFEAASTDVSIVRRGCRTIPHVLGMQIQQTLKISNDDATPHNFHFMPKLNPDWNHSQPPGAVSLEKKFSQPEVLIPLKCNQHPWEKAYVSVLSHPFFAVSGLNGSYQITGLPPGQYFITAWHERFGEQTVEISVGVNEQRKLDFSFSQSENQSKP